MGLLHLSVVPLKLLWLLPVNSMGARRGHLVPLTSQLKSLRGQDKRCISVLASDDLASWEKQECCVLVEHYDKKLASAGTTRQPMAEALS